MYDLIIIGGGPAAMTAGIYASRKKLDTLILTKDFSGQAGKAAWIENYPGFESISGIDLMAKFRSQLEKFPIDINEGEEVKEIKKEGNLFVVRTTEKDRYLTKTIIIASGRDPRPLEVSGEKEFLGKGVSYCVTCDGPLFSQKPVAVIGGGNSGFMAAFELSRYCPKVYLIEAGKVPKADEVNQEKARGEKNLEVLTSTKTKEIRGDKFVTGLLIETDSQEKELAVQGVFIEIGSLPATNFVKDLVDFSERDEIVIDPLTGETKTPGLFAAGDVTTVRDKQVIIACAEGAKAALSAYYYLSKL